MADLVALAHDIDGLKQPGDERIAELARRQHGVVAYRQLVEMGFGRGAIEHRIACGRLHRVHRGVYAVGHRRISSRGLCMAAVLACGPGAVASHRWAAAIWGIRPNASRTVDVTTQGRSRHPRRGIRVHNARRLHPDDWTTRDGIPITTVARTLLDLAETVRRQQLRRAFEHAERLRLLDIRALEELCKRSRGRRGLRPLKALLAEAKGPPPATRSDLEDRFLDLVREANLPLPVVNGLVEGFEVDMHWPERQLVVELDSRAWHGTDAAFERDRMRDTELQLAEHRVLRITHRRLEGAPESVVSDLRRALG